MWGEGFDVTGYGISELDEWVLKDFVTYALQPLYKEDAVNPEV